jgi:hypothetical protein
MLSLAPCSDEAKARARSHGVGREGWAGCLALSEPDLSKGRPIVDNHADSSRGAVTVACSTRSAIDPRGDPRWPVNLLRPPSGPSLGRARGTNDGHQRPRTTMRARQSAAPSWCVCPATPRCPATSASVSRRSGWRCRRRWARSGGSAGHARHTAVLAVLRGRDQWWRTARLWSTRTASCGQKTSNGSTTFGSLWRCPQGRDDAPYRGEEPDGGLATLCFVPTLPAETYPAISCGGSFGSRSTTGLNSRTVPTGTLRQVRQSIHGP